MDVTLFRIYLLLPGLGNKVGEVWGGVGCGRMRGFFQNRGEVT